MLKITECGIDYEIDYSNDNIRNVLLRHIEKLQAEAITEPDVPEGWQLVPNEPTEAMVEAGIDDSEKFETSFSSIYKAMLAAAPKKEG